MKHYHLIVIGAGSGGLVTAAGAAGLGARVALIEKNQMGGDCLNTGCVPSKAIIRTAKLVHDARTSARFGLPSLTPVVDIPQVLASVREAQSKLAHHDSVERFQSLGVDVIQGNFAFTSPHDVSDGKVTLQAKRFVIATGAGPFMPPIPGLLDAPYLTSDTVWSITELPKRLIVLGGGPIGAELTQVFARLGSHVTVVEMMDRLLIREDPEVSAMMTQRFQDEGIDVRIGTKAMAIQKGSDGWELLTEHPIHGKQVIPFDSILVAVGRAAHVDGLQLEKAGVVYSKKGIQVSATLQTSAPHIYACGDVAGPYQFTHTADYQARLIIRNALFPGKSKVDYRVVPWCTFTDPEVARVGLNESDAKAQKILHDVHTYSMSDLDRAVCDREDTGFITVITPKNSDQVLGATIVGEHAGDVIHELVLAMKEKIGLQKIAGMIHIYPTLAEISKRIADTQQRTRLTPRVKGWMKRYLHWSLG